MITSWADANDAVKTAKPVSFKDEGSGNVKKKPEPEYGSGQDEEDDGEESGDDSTLEPEEDEEEARYILMTFKSVL